jgi:hypothetical protein
MTEQDRERLDALEDAKEGLFKRIDIGILTGICALFISFVGVITSRASFKMSQETQKARVLPIMDVEMGYITKRIDGEERPYFELSLNNVGAGIAHIQRIEPVQNGQPIATSQAFEDAVMNRRMRGWATLTERAGAGYVRAGESRVPRSYRIGGGASDIAPYLRGDYGVPFENLDVEVCYCSVFDDCWETSWLRTAEPEPVKACLSGEEPIDRFADYIEQRDAARRERAGNSE